MHEPFSNARCIFMDCDGVIFDVNPQKTEAFRLALKGEPSEAVEALVEYHVTHGGVSRYAKFDHFYRNLRPHPDPESATAEAAKRFATIVRQGYARLKPRHEALRFVSEATAPVHVVSGSDGDELCGVFEGHGIADAFAGVHGSPTTKAVHMRRILGDLGVGPEDAVHLGDGWGDYDACLQLDMRFVFLEEMSEWSGAEQSWSTETFAWARTWDDLMRGRYRGRT